MKQFEYKTTALPTHENLHYQLERFGYEGWELCGIYGCLIFKREKAQGSERAKMREENETDE